jgi:transposase-like protein
MEPTVDLTNPIFTDEEAARKHFEAIHWPNGPICPHCGATSEHITLMVGKTTRPGLHQCNVCHEPFTVKMGTVMEASHLSYRKWALGFYLMASSKKGISTHQLHWTLGVTYKTAWFMAHRIREAMRPRDGGQLGGEGKAVEIDKTFVGGLEKNKHRSKRKHVGTGGAGKEAVFSLVERGGKVRSRHVAEVTAATLRSILMAHVHAATFVMTDEGATAKSLGRGFKNHGMANHTIGEYVRGDAHTNTIEGYFQFSQARDYRCLSPCQRRTPEAVSVRVRFPLQRTRRARG